MSTERPDMESIAPHKLTTGQIAAGVLWGNLMTLAVIAGAAAIVCLIWLVVKPV